MKHYLGAGLRNSDGSARVNPRLPGYSPYTDPKIFPAFGGDEFDPPPYSWDRRSIIDIPKVTRSRSSLVLSIITMFAHTVASVLQFGGTKATQRRINRFLHPHGPNRTVICALATYSTIGGLQHFNRRVLKNVALRSVEKRPALAILSGDHAVALPKINGLEIVAPKSQPRFLAVAFLKSLSTGSALMICHINLLPLAFAVRLFRPRLPIILFVHGCEVWNAPGQRKMRFYEPWLIGALTRIVSVSRFTAERMQREFVLMPDKFRFLPNAVDPLDKATAASAPQPLTILTVSRLGLGEREKNVHEMIASVALLRERLPSVKYEIIGSGALLPELEALAARLGVADVVTFFGEVGDRERREAYERAAVFAMPSNKEGFGIVYLEAWQHAKPVICSQFGAAREIVADGVDGLIVDPSNVDLLAGALYDLLTQPELAASMGERGRQKVERVYLNAHFRHNLDEILDELLVDSVLPDHEAGISPEAESL